MTRSSSSGSGSSNPRTQALSHRNRNLQIRLRTRGEQTRDRGGLDGGLRCGAALADGVFDVAVGAGGDGGAEAGGLLGVNCGFWKGM
jgi:hypothetical protein